MRKRPTDALASYFGDMHTASVYEEINVTVSIYMRAVEALEPIGWRIGFVFPASILR